MMFDFGPWETGSQNAMDVKTLLLRDDIWDLQASDDYDKERVAREPLEFSDGTYLSIFRDTDPFGFILFLPMRNGIYEQHTAFVETHRGAVAMRLIEGSISLLFLKTPATAIITKCPHWHPASVVMARKIGGNLRYKIDKFATRKGTLYGADIYGMSILEWAWKNHGAYAEIGHRWHEEVFKHVAAHEDDEAHNGFLGLALKVGERRPHIGLSIYNAWAEIAGYAPGALIWADGQGNSLIDIHGAHVLNSGVQAVAVLPKHPCPPLQPSEPLSAQA